MLRLVGLWQEFQQANIAVKRLCAMTGIRFNSGKRGRPDGKPQNEVAPIAGEKDFGF